MIYKIVDVEMRIVDHIGEVERGNKVWGFFKSGYS